MTNSTMQAHETTTDNATDNDDLGNVSLLDLNHGDNPTDFGGKCLSLDGQGNELWLFGDRVANRHEDEDGDVYWSDNVQGWGYDRAQSID